ncbi:transcription termination/antitermination protein NusA [Longibacter salinarum]|uniref:Transcription termination/antitermination protein NusA n=1 Tax=Longibacter salinarum TaxID=1850348 RepID=A0A2A8D381_9BACT|nr:transcription termination factor NusA [Longibacter salinarum]PEN15098.1 transcription termination/antitermination protein NusA [Longibacter salinarum]
MRSADLVSSFGEIARAKDIDRETLQIIVEDVIRAMIDKRYGSDEAFEIIFNPNQGDIQILHIQEIVEDYNLVDPVTQIEERHAKQLDEDFEEGDEVASELDISDFGRRAVLTARQTFRQRIRDIEKEKIYDEYSDLIGEIIVGEIYQVRRHEALLMHDGVEVVLPRNEQIPGDHYRKGNMLRTVVKEVRRDAGSDPQVVVSRTSPVFMERLFEIEVPEVYDGIVEIKKIARIPGDRAKVAVVSHDERVDPVGACVGVKGVRIHAVVRELSNENIDVMEWSENPSQMVARALSPANPVSVKLNDDADPPRARVEVAADEVSQAIGRRGVNIKLASQLTGYEIDVYREIPSDEEDIDIEEFGDELEQETIEKLKHIGCDTGKAVLELSADALGRRADLDRDTAQRVLDIISAEFEKGPGIVETIERGDFTIESLEDEDIGSDEREPRSEEDLVDAPESAAEESSGGPADRPPEDFAAEELAADMPTEEDAPAEDVGGPVADFGPDGPEAAEDAAVPEERTEMSAESPEADAVSEEAIAEETDEPEPTATAPGPDPETLSDESVPPTDEIDPTDSKDPQSPDLADDEVSDDEAEEAGAAPKMDAEEDSLTDTPDETVAGAVEEEPEAKE